MIDTEEDLRWSVLTQRKKNCTRKAIEPLHRVAHPMRGVIDRGTDVKIHRKLVRRLSGKEMGRDEWSFVSYAVLANIPCSTCCSVRHPEAVVTRCSVCTGPRTPRMGPFDPIFCVCLSRRRFIGHGWIFSRTLYGYSRVDTLTDLTCPLFGVN